MSLTLPPEGTGWSKGFTVAPWPVDCCFLGVRGLRFFVSLARIEVWAVLDVIVNGLGM